VTVILLDDLVHEWSKGVVRIVGAGIDTNTGVGPLGSGENSLSEGETEFVSSVLAFLPNVWGKALGKEGFGTSWEVWEVLNVLWALKVAADHSSSDVRLLSEWTPRFSDVGSE